MRSYEKVTRKPARLTTPDCLPRSAYPAKVCTASRQMASSRSKSTTICVSARKPPRNSRLSSDRQAIRNKLPCGSPDHPRDEPFPTTGQPLTSTVQQTTRPTGSWYRSQSSLPGLIIVAGASHRCIDLIPPFRKGLRCARINPEKIRGAARRPNDDDPAFVYNSRRSPSRRPNRFRISRLLMLPHRKHSDLYRITSPLQALAFTSEAHWAPWPARHVLVPPP